MPLLGWAARLPGVSYKHTLKIQHEPQRLDELPSARQDRQSEARTLFTMSTEFKF